MSFHDVTATLRYLAPTNQRPVYFASRAGADAQFDIDVGFDDWEVTIHDARAVRPAPSLEYHGFACVKHRTSVNDFYALESQRDEYEAELIQLICAQTGAVGARVFDHTLRSDSATVRGSRHTREPASFIHNDYTDASANKRLLDVLSADEARQRSRSRFAIINVWRPIREPVVSSPMTCCDASTLSPGDLIAAERRAQDRIGELEFVRWNPAHRWYYFPEMTCDEVLLIKTYDSASDGRATRCVHTAFSHSETQQDSPPRESIESRLLVFYQSKD